MESVANFSNCLCFCRKIAITGSPDKLVTPTNRKHDLCQIWRKGNDAIYLWR